MSALTKCIMKYHLIVVGIIQVKKVMTSHHIIPCRNAMHARNYLKLLSNPSVCQGSVLKPRWRAYTKAARVRQGDARAQQRHAYARAACICQGSACTPRRRPNARAACVHHGGVCMPSQCAYAKAAHVQPGGMHAHQWRVRSGGARQTW